MVKTQFMSLWDGLLTDPNCRVMVMGATNRPQDVDQAILRRMPCTFYIGNPVRISLFFKNNIVKVFFEISFIYMNKICFAGCRRTSENFRSYSA